MFGGMTVIVKPLNRDRVVGGLGVGAGGPDLNGDPTATVAHTDAEGPQREGLDKRIQAITRDVAQAAMFGQGVLAETDDVVGVVGAG